MELRGDRPEMAHLARAVGIEGIEEHVDLVRARDEIEAHRAHRAPKLAPLDGAVAVVVPLAEDVEHARGR